MQVLYELVTVIRERLSKHVTDENWEGGQTRGAISQETCLLWYRIDSKPRVTGCTSFLRFGAFLPCHGFGTAGGFGFRGDWSYSDIQSANEKQGKRRKDV